MVVIFIFVQNLVMVSITQNVWQHNRFVDNVKGEPDLQNLKNITFHLENETHFILKL